MCWSPFICILVPTSKQAQTSNATLTHPPIHSSLCKLRVQAHSRAIVNLHVSDFLIKHVLYSLFINISHKLILMQIAKIRKATLFMEPPKPQIQNTNCKRRIKSLTIHQKEKYKTKHIYNYMSHLIVFPQGRA